jgi:SAM-dependent methyltransferase
MLLFTHWFVVWLGSAMVLATSTKKNQSFDSRTTLSRSEARQVYDRFAEEGHATGGKDADSGYGGPAVTAMLEMADFESANTVLDYGCGQGKLAELVFKKKSSSLHNPTTPLQWRGIDQSPEMVERFRESCCHDKFGNGCTVELLESGDPNDVSCELHSVDRFVSTYCLDLLSEEDMYKVLDLAQKSLHPERGLLLLAGITWGYKSKKSSSIQTFVMTAVWEVLYQIRRKKVGGCRPQHLVPYLEARGWRIEKVVQTMPNGFPWMVSEVVSARPPL